MTFEKRCLDLEMRFTDDRIGGYASVFYDGTPETEYRISENIYERVAPTAFDRLIHGNDDVLASFNHDFNTLLGRRSANTLDLSVDKKGLYWSVPYDSEDPDHVRIRRKIQKGELRGCSFAFRTIKDDWKFEGNKRIRTLLDVEVSELGPVLTPAYKGALVASRSDNADEALASLKLYESQLLINDLLSMKKL